MVAAAYGGAAPVFGPRLHHPEAVRSAADPGDRAGGRARGDGQRRGAPADPRFRAYQRDLQRFVFRSGQLMRPVFEAAKQAPRRIVYGEGEDERVLRAAQTLVDDGIARPILLGRRAVIERKVREMGLRIDLDRRCARARPGAGRRRVRPAAGGLPAPGRPARHPAGRGGASAWRGAARWPRRCCCTPAWRMRRSAAAPRTGGGRSSTCCRSFRAGRG